MATIKYKLGKPYDLYTGLIHGIYPVKDGVATLPEAAEKKGGRVLMRDYGAVKFDETAKSADKK